MSKFYELQRNNTCAEDNSYTGKIYVSNKHILNNLQKFKTFNIGNIVVSAQSDFVFYLYEDNTFSLSNVKNIKNAENFIYKICNCMVE